MTLKYIVKLIKDNGSILSLGNIDSYEKKVIDISIKKRDRIAIMNIVLDNKNNEFNNDFKNFNDITVKISNDSGAFGLLVPFFVPSTTDFQPTLLRFFGEVIEVIPNEDNTRVTLTCKGTNAVETERLISTVDNDVDLGQHIVNVYNEEIPEVDTSGVNISTGIILDEIKADAQIVKDHTDDLLREGDFKLDIGFDNILELFENNKGSSGITLIDGNGGNVIKGSNKLRTSNLSNKNKVTVIGGQETIPDFDEDQIVWNAGDSTVILLSHSVADLGFVKFDSITQVENTDFEIIQEGNAIKLLTISDGETIDVQYDFKSQVWWSEQDPTAIKIREIAIKDPTILTQSRAELLSKATLAKIGITQTKGDISSDDIKIDFKWYQTLNLNLAAFQGEHKIVGYTENINDIYLVTFDLAEVLDDNNKQILSIIKEIDKLKGADITTAVIRDGFNLQDMVLDSDVVEGFETPIGTRFTWDVSLWDSGDTWDEGEGIETQFL